MGVCFGLNIVEWPSKLGSKIPTHRFLIGHRAGEQLEKQEVMRETRGERGGAGGCGLRGVLAIRRVSIRLTCIFLQQK